MVAWRFGIRLEKYMTTPKSNPSDQGEENYNAAHNQTWVVVERAIGVCKPGFRYYLIQD